MNTRITAITSAPWCDAQAAKLRSLLAWGATVEQIAERMRRTVEFILARIAVDALVEAA